MNSQLLNINYELSKDGLQVALFNDGRYTIKYPLAVWQATPAAGRRFLADSFFYSRTRALTLFNYRLAYQFPKPFFKSFIDYGLNNTLPCLGEINNLSSVKLLKEFAADERAGRIVFKKGVAAGRLERLVTLPNRAVLALSFGKDSILSYGLAKELGLDLLLVTANEMEGSSGDEWKIKSRIIKDFCREQKVKVHFFQDNVDELYYHRRVKKHLTEANNTNSLLAYSLELLPFVYYHRARYLIFGNEQNLNDYYLTNSGFKFYPSFDQSTAYTARQNKYWRQAAGRQFKVISLVEPLYNLAEFKILYHRYPGLLKYIMSCEPYKGSLDRWCYRCPMCAKAFLYSAAFGDPKKIAFNRNFFDKKYSELYPLFAIKPLRHYERPPQVKEEQLLSFLLCYRQGLQGDLIDLFKQRYLAEALTKEKSLRKKYFGVYPAVNLPVELKNKVLGIYRQELKGWS